MKVLVAVDTSLASGGIIDAVLERAWPPRSMFYLVSVVEKTTGPFAKAEYTGEESESEEHAATKARLYDLMLHMKRKLPNASVFGEVLSGGAAETIVAKADELDVDMIIIGHQAQSKRGPALGSVAEAVVQRAHCSVVVVKPKIFSESLPEGMKPHGATVR